MKPRSPRKDTCYPARISTDSGIALDAMVYDMSLDGNGLWVAIDGLLNLAAISQDKSVNVIVNDAIAFQGEIKWTGYHPHHHTSGVGVMVNSAA